MIELFLLKPETIPDISKKSGIPEENLQNLYEYDQQFSLVTKIAVVEYPATEGIVNRALRDAAEKWKPFVAGGKCPTCEMGHRETKGLVCQTCGTDYGQRLSDDV